MFSNILNTKQSLEPNVYFTSIIMTTVRMATMLNPVSMMPVHISTLNRKFK